MIGFDKQWTAKDITVAAIGPDRLSPVVFVLWAAGRKMPPLPRLGSM